MYEAIDLVAEPIGVARNTRKRVFIACKYRDGELLRNRVNDKDNSELD